MGRSLFTTHSTRERNTNYKLFLLSKESIYKLYSYSVQKIKIVTPTSARLSKLHIIKYNNITT